MRTLLILAGVLGLAGLFALAATRLPPPGGLPPVAADTNEASREVAAATPPAPAADGRAPASAARDVTPSDATRLDPVFDEAGLTRLPPRLPGPEPEAEPADATREVRLRLFPRPVALDAGTLRIGESTLRLSDLSAPAPEARCGPGAEPCGMQARTALRAFLRGRAVRCEAPEGFGWQAETIESACDVGGVDVGEWLVRNGWAEAAPGGPYAGLEAEARERRLGLWR